VVRDLEEGAESGSFLIGRTLKRVFAEAQPEKLPVLFHYYSGCCPGRRVYIFRIVPPGGDLAT
jgi:uncharacterized protein (DUF779 family)